MKRKNCWVLLLLVLTGIVLGGFIGTMAQECILAVLAEFWTVLRFRFSVNY